MPGQCVAKITHLHHPRCAMSSTLSVGGSNPHNASTILLRIILRMVWFALTGFGVVLFLTRWLLFLWISCRVFRPYFPSVWLIIKFCAFCQCRMRFFAFLTFSAKSRFSGRNLRAFSSRRFGVITVPQQMEYFSWPQGGEFFLAARSVLFWGQFWWRWFSVSSFALFFLIGQCFFFGFFDCPLGNGEIKFLAFFGLHRRLCLKTGKRRLLFPL